MYAVEHPDAWLQADISPVYRVVPAFRTYDPDSPWPGSGRFDDGNRETLYLALSAEGAVAEFYRRHPELLWMHPRTGIELFELTLVLEHEGLDVRTEPQSNAVGFPHERLTSSDMRADDRYAECRVLADDVDDATGVFIAYPSAAYDQAENVVTLGLSGSGRWVASGATQLPLVAIDSGRLNPLPPGADK